MEEITKNTAKNTILLYFLTFAKLVFPLLTLPYLTRVLTSESYGVVSYVKSCMAYMQIIVDFGFMLSAVKDIVKANGNEKEIGLIVGHVIGARLILAFCILALTIVLCFCIPILRAYKLYTILYVVSIMITAFSADYLFRGIEKMHIITIVFVAAKGLVTALTFILVKNDGDLLLIPIMEIIGNLASVIVTWLFIKKLKIRVYFKNIKETWIKLKDSGIYFISTFSSTAFTALNTVLIGIVVTDLTQVAFWSVAWQLVSAVLNLYAPIIDGVYPQMLQKKDLKFLLKILTLFMPIILLGCAFCFICAKWILLIFGGATYAGAVPVFRLLLPLLIFSFPSMLFGWPSLGVVGKEKQVTLSTFCAAIFQVVGLILLVVIGGFTIYTVAILRCITEAVIMLIRLIFLLKNKEEFKR